MDLIAKTDQQVFLSLIDRAKNLVNSGVLRIIFVSSEGSLVNCTSSSSRRAPIVELVDVSDEQAKEYLGHCIPADLTKDVAALTGGRFVHLLASVEVYTRLKKEQRNTANAVNIIREYLIMSIVKSKVVEIHKQEKWVCALEKSIMKIVLSKGSVYPDLLVYELKEKATTIASVVHHLVSNNFLRDQADGKIAFHSRLVRWCMQNDIIPFAEEHE